MARSFTEIICPICNKKTNKHTTEVNRQLKIGRKVYCSRECSIVGIKYSHIKYPKIKQNCSECNKIFETSKAKKSKKFCSKICANNYSRRFVDYSKVSKTLKNSWSSGKITKKKKNIIISNCQICNQTILTTRKTCSKECYLKLLSKQTRENVNCGGETNYKKYEYKNISMDSSWEVELAKFLDSKSIEWKRSKKMMFFWTDLKNEKRRYYPDFYLPQYDLYLDPKNKFLIPRDRYKINKVIEENNIKIIWGLLEDILKELNKIITK